MRRHRPLIIVRRTFSTTVRFNTQVLLDAAFVREQSRSVQSHLPCLYNPISNEVIVTRSTAIPLSSISSTNRSASSSSPSLTSCNATMLPWIRILYVHGVALTPSSSTIFSNSWHASTTLFALNIPSRRELYTTDSATNPSYCISLKRATSKELQAAEPGGVLAGFGSSSSLKKMLSARSTWFFLASAAITLSYISGLSLASSSSM